MLGWKPKSRNSNVASVRFRCLIPMHGLRIRDFPIELFEPSREEIYQAVIFSKCYGEVDQALARRLRLRGAKVILDLCDNHFYNPYDLPEYHRARRDLLAMIELADLLVCSTPTLADIVVAEASLPRRPEVVGDPVELSNEDLVRSQTARAHGRTEGRKLLWFGIHGSPNAPCGIADICRVSEVLRQAAREHPFHLVVCSNSQENYERLARSLDFPSYYVEYSRNEFPSLLAQTDGVILPVNQNPFTLAKSHNRLSTSLFAGIPVVADSIPSYREFEDYCVLDSWHDGLTEILTEPEKARGRAMMGREYILQKWMPSHVADRWLEILLPLVDSHSPDLQRGGR